MPNMRLYIVAVILCAQDGLVKATKSKFESKASENSGYHGSAHGVEDADKPDSSDAIKMLSDEMKMVMDLEDSADAARKFVPIFPMMTLTQNEYDPATGGFINSNFQANLARLTDAIHVDPLGGGLSDPGNYSQKLSDFATKVLGYAKLVDPDAMKKALQCFETKADQIVNDLQHSRTIESAMAKCEEEKTAEGMKRYNKELFENREDCMEKIAVSVIQQAEQKQEVLEKIRICKEVKTAATGGAAICVLEAIMDSSLDDKEKKKAAMQVKMNITICLAEAKNIYTMQFREEVAYSMATCRNLIRLRKYVCSDDMRSIFPDARAIGTKLAAMGGKYRAQLSRALNEHAGYSEELARSKRGFHGFFKDAHELEANGGPDAGWTTVTKTFEKSQTSESKSSVSVTVNGSFCYMGVACVKASAGLSEEDAQADSKHMKQIVSFQMRAMDIQHYWFPFDILNDDTLLSESFAKHSWHKPYQWQKGAGWAKEREGNSPLLAYRSKIIFCKNTRVSIVSGSGSEMKTLSKTKAGAGPGVRLPMVGASVRTDVKKRSEKATDVHLIVDGVGICGYVLTQLSNKALPINDGTADNDEGRKEEKAQQEERFDKALATMMKVDEELEKQEGCKREISSQQKERLDKALATMMKVDDLITFFVDIMLHKLKKLEDLDPTGSAYRANNAEL